MKSFFQIHSRNELADFLEIPRSKLTHVLYIEKVDSYYVSFEIPKKNGEVRQINAPTGTLKDLQERLAYALWECHQEVHQNNKSVHSGISHAFEKKKSIITNAKIHRNKRFILNIDLENFFDFFHFGRVQGFFQHSKQFYLPKEVATVIAQLTCYHGCLPQGAPSSPIITNMICKILDMRLLKLVKKYKLDYTRYADDLTFSTNNKTFIDTQKDFLREITREIERAGFHINNNKTRLVYRDSKQKVTGLIVNKKLNVDREYCKKTKAMANTLYTRGSYVIDGTFGTINQLEGRFSFIDQLDTYNNRLDKDTKHNFRKLNGREKQYQKFLFYKYFYSHDKPLVVTEGKTDILYLKAALKNLYLDYPNLISKISEDKFEFKISFLKRPKRLNYFFGISSDGADAMKNLYNYFSPSQGDKKNYPDLWGYFTKVCHSRPANPVILIFDNELSNKKKPLSNFANHSCLGIDKLKNELMVPLIDKGNLFLITNPLVDGRNECEIEDLFESSVLNQIIDGRTFSLKDKYDIDENYGKEIFSRYVYTHYQKIDFSKFKSILDNMNNIIQSY